MVTVVAAVGVVETIDKDAARPTPSLCGLCAEYGILGVVIVVVPVDRGLVFVEESIADDVVVDDSPVVLVAVVAAAGGAAPPPPPGRMVVVCLIPSVTW